MSNKDRYEKLRIREYLLSVKEFVNYSSIARELGLSKQVISLFLRDEYHLDSISKDKLVMIQEFIHRL